MQSIRLWFCIVWKSYCYHVHTLRMRHYLLVGLRSDLGMPLSIHWFVCHLHSSITLFNFCTFPCKPLNKLTSILVDAIIMGFPWTDWLLVTFHKNPQFRVLFHIEYQLKAFTDFLYWWLIMHHWWCDWLEFCCHWCDMVGWDLSIITVTFLLPLISS